MRDDAIEVDSAVLRRRAADLTDIGYRLGDGLGQTPGLSVVAPGWAAAEALSAVELAVHAWLTATGIAVGHAADKIRAAADAYEDTDERAARRLAGIR